MKPKTILILSIVLLILLLALTGYTGRSENSFTGYLYSLSDGQVDTSTEITDTVVSNLEGSLVGQSKDDGSNWSIPNILKNLITGGGY